MRRWLMPLTAAVLTNALVAAAAMGAGGAPRHRLPKAAHLANSTKRTSHSKAACSPPSSPPARVVPVPASPKAPSCPHAPPVAVTPGA